MAENLVYKIDVMTDLLYQEKWQEGYSMFHEIMEQLTSVMTKIVTNPQQKMIDDKKVLDALEMASKVMAIKDIVLLADIFHYEIRPEINKIIG